MSPNSGYSVPVGIEQSIGTSKYPIEFGGIIEVERMHPHINAGAHHAVHSRRTGVVRRCRAIIPSGLCHGRPGGSGNRVRSASIGYRRATRCLPGNRGVFQSTPP